MSDAPSNAHMGTVLVVDDMPDNVAVLFDHLSRSGFKVLAAESGPSALMQTKHAQPDLVLLDVMMPDLDGFEVCRRLKRHPETAHIPVLFMTALADADDKVRGFEAGGVDYITKPFQHEEVLARVTTHLTLRHLRDELAAANADLEARVTARTDELAAALTEVEALRDRLQDENQYLREEVEHAHGAVGIVGQSPALSRVLDQVERVAPTDAAVLILGETGTGKELFARAVHAQSPRRDRPLVKVNCAALPESLIESELFGHEKGAFTGATARRAGRFELADGGTIFLDEIGDLPLALQAKLLRVLQEGEFERLGGTKTHTVDVRVIAATNRDLSRRVADGEFREDLYYRLNVVPLMLPPLRERQGDIRLLVEHVLAKAAPRFGRPVPEVPEAVMAAFEAYAWPGNVRELANVVERAVILSDGPALRLDAPLGASAPPTSGAVGPAASGTTMEAVERAHIVHVLGTTGWRVRGPGGAAEVLGLNPSTLRSRMKKLGIERPQPTA
ncbi:MAG: hypothetical protein Rubg2KO_21780 [Rubricoccaceae bacterium]